MRVFRVIWVSVFLLGLFLTGCQGITAGSTLPALIDNSPSPEETGSPPGEPTPTVLPIILGETSGSIWVRLDYPADGTIVNTPQVIFQGAAPPETVISINEEILLTSQDGHFQTILSLDEGANLVEFIASDLQGNELDTILTIYYEP